MVKRTTKQYTQWFASSKWRDSLSLLFSLPSLFSFHTSYPQHPFSHAQSVQPSLINLISFFLLLNNNTHTHTHLRFSTASLSLDPTAPSHFLFIFRLSNCFNHRNEIQQKDLSHDTFNTLTTITNDHDTSCHVQVRLRPDTGSTLTN